MKLEVLVSTMKQTDHSLLEKMNIQSDVIVINQCDKYAHEQFCYKGNNVQFFHFGERGVGLSRNNALMRATADISVLADDDITYVQDYKEIILSAFQETPKADIILFNVPSKNPQRPTYNITSSRRVRWYNCLRYGAVKVTIKTEQIKKNNIYFSLLFGGGARYGSGEDSLFIFECLKKGLKIYTNPSIIGYVEQQDSSWFNGFTDKFFIDKGALYYSISRRWAKLLCLQFIVRHRAMYIHTLSLRKAFTLMLKGIRLIKRLDSVSEYSKDE